MMRFIKHVLCDMTIQYHTIFVGRRRGMAWTAGGRAFCSARYDILSKI